MKHWNEEEYGPAEDMGVIEDQSFDGFTVGDRVEATSDSPDEEFFREDEGKVIGVSFSKGGLFGPGGKKLVVHFEGMDPVHVPDPSDYLEKL